MKHRYQMWLYGLFFLFFLQLLSDFIESIYVFGLLSTGVTVEIISVVLLFSPIVLLVPRKGLSKTVFTLLVFGVLVCRLIAVTLGPSAKMVLSGMGVGCWLILFPGWLWHISGSAPEKISGSGDARTLTLGLGLLIALALSILLRMLGASFDISTYGWTQFLAWLGVVLCGWIIIRTPLPGIKSAIKSKESPKSTANPAFWKVAGLSMGISAVLLCVYFALMSPNIIARWTGVPYPLIISVLVPVLGLFAWLMISRPQRMMSIPRRNLLLWNIFFVLSLVLTLIAHQVEFSSDLNAYPLSEPPVTILHHIPLFLMLLLSPVVFLDFIYFLREILEIRPASRQLGGGFTLASLYILLMVLAQVFTTVYDYIPVVGPWFRDRFWFVFLCVGLGFTVPVLLLRELRSESKTAFIRPQSYRLLAGGILLFIVVSLAIAWFSVPTPPQPEPAGALRILTYNIQQGYSEEGEKNFTGQLEVLRDVNADIIGLQESDTNRIAGGNSDIVGYFARALNMHAYYGPKTVPGTFGIALLSKYPLQFAETFYMYSSGEQTATIYARISVDGVDYNIYVTHLGNGGPIVQQKAILEHASGRGSVIMMGDFNFRPESDQYNLTTSVLEDAWIVQNTPAETGPELDPKRRIDHIFVTPGTHIVKSRYIVSPASDHPALWAELTW